MNKKKCVCFGMGSYCNLDFSWKMVKDVWVGDQRVGRGNVGPTSLFFLFHFFYKKKNPNKFIKYHREYQFLLNCFFNIKICPFRLKLPLL